jgi:hypothetical protein
MIIKFMLYRSYILHFMVRMVQLSKSLHPTRQSANPWNLSGKQAKTDVRKHSFGMRVIEEWNKIPDEIKNVGKLATFKTQMKHKQ